MSPGSMTRWSGRAACTVSILAANIDAKSDATHALPRAAVQLCTATYTTSVLCASCSENSTLLSMSCRMTLPGGPVWM